MDRKSCEEAVYSGIEGTTVLSNSYKVKTSESRRSVKIKRFPLLLLQAPLAES
jgi:hypothetical protein